MTSMLPLNYQVNSNSVHIRLEKDQFEIIRQILFSLEDFFDDDFDSVNPWTREEIIEIRQTSFLDFEPLGIQMSILNLLKLASIFSQDPVTVRKPLKVDKSNEALFTEIITDFGKIESVFRATFPVE
jgi:hypothetical protein